MEPWEREQLLAVYATERQDDQSALAIAFVIATAGITYVTIGAAYLNDHCGSKGCTGGVPGWTPILAPLIPMALFGFLALNLAATRMRSVHLQRLEFALRIPLVKDEELPTAPWFPSFHTDAGLVYRAMDSWSKPRFTRLLFMAVTLITYPVIYFALLGFTFVALRDAAASGLKTFFIYFYIIIAVIEGLAILMCLVGERFKYKRPMAEVGTAESQQGVGTGSDTRELDQEIAEVRQDKEPTIDVQDFEDAAVLRDRGKQLLDDKDTRQQEWAILSGEVERLRDLLRQHGIDAQDGAA